MKKTLLLSLLASGVLLAPTVQAQTTFRVGPRVGFALSTVHFAEEYSSTSLRPGFEAGLQASLQRGHFAFQPAVLYTQRGFKQDFNFVSIDPGFGGPTADRVRLNYLSVPLLLAFTQHQGGRGLQVFAGPYASVLLGGNRELTYSYSSGSVQGRVVAAESYQTLYNPASSYYVPDYSYYSKRFDVGVQGGLGYRLGHALLQVSYSLGLRNLRPPQTVVNGPDSYTYEGTAYRNRSLQASLTYLFGPKS